MAKIEINVNELGERVSIGMEDEQGWQAGAATITVYSNASVYISAIDGVELTREEAIKVFREALDALG